MKLKTTNQLKTEMKLTAGNAISWQHLPKARQKRIWKQTRQSLRQALNSGAWARAHGLKAS